MKKIKPTDKEINDVLNKASDENSKGNTKWPGMTYEQGVENALMWVFGDNDNNPMED